MRAPSCQATPLIAAAAAAVFALSAETAWCQPPDLVDSFLEARESLRPTDPGSPLDSSRDELKQAIQAEFNAPALAPTPAPPTPGFYPPPAKGSPSSAASRSPVYPPPPIAPAFVTTAPMASAMSPEQLLRDTAFRLDCLAHQLELKELFAQADALRAQATRLRASARPDKRVKGGPIGMPSRARPYTPDPGPPQFDRPQRRESDARTRRPPSRPFFPSDGPIPERRLGEMVERAKRSNDAERERPGDWHLHDHDDAGSE